jgi:hypothetical protein
MTLTSPTISTRIQKEDNNNIINDPIFDHKLDLITAGARPYLKEHLLQKYLGITVQLSLITS